MVKVKQKNGFEVTLLNPNEKGRKYADELANGVKQTNNGLLKTDSLGKPVRLSKEQKAYRAGYLDARNDNAKAFNHNKKKKAEKAAARKNGTKKK